MKFFCEKCGVPINIGYKKKKLCVGCTVEKKKYYIPPVKHKQINFNPRKSVQVGKSYLEICIENIAREKRISIEKARKLALVEINRSKTII